MMWKVLHMSEMSSIQYAGRIRFMQRSKQKLWRTLFAAGKLKRKKGNYIGINWNAIGKTKRTSEVTRFGLAICLYYFDLRHLLLCGFCECGGDGLVSGAVVSNGTSGFLGLISGWAGTSVCVWSSHVLLVNGTSLGSLASFHSPKTVYLVVCLYISPVMNRHLVQGLPTFHPMIARTMPILMSQIQIWNYFLEKFDLVHLFSSCASLGTLGWPPG